MPMQENAALQPVHRVERGAQQEVLVAEPSRSAHLFQAGSSGRPKGARHEAAPVPEADGEPEAHGHQHAA